MNKHASTTQIVLRPLHLEAVSQSTCHAPRVDPYLPLAVTLLNQHPLNQRHRVRLEVIIPKPTASDDATHASPKGEGGGGSPHPQRFTGTLNRCTPAGSALLSQSATALFHDPSQRKHDPLQAEEKNTPLLPKNTEKIDMLRKEAGSTPPHHLKNYPTLTRPHSC